MKKHAIIPIFIPHMGCPNDCVFCNQKQITARQRPVTEQDVKLIIETWLSTLEPRGVETIEAAFFGGSFTGIPMELQSAYLTAASTYKKTGRIQKIRLSTRPDYISSDILDNLNQHGVDAIELGVQSFDDHVLSLSDRGHDSNAVYRAAELIHDFGFELGIQLMIGLPGDTEESCIRSAREAVRLSPEAARLYPTVILKDTKLYEQFLQGTYTPLSEDEAVCRTAAMYKILDDAGIKIMRVGLKSTDFVTEDCGTFGHTYHPAFRQLVEGYLAREQLTTQLSALGIGPDDADRPPARIGRDRIKVDFYASSRSFSCMVGHQGRNRKFFLENYPSLNILYKVDQTLTDSQFKVTIKGDRT